MRPRVSVLMSVYNAIDSIQDAINSVLNQTFTDFEFVIIDDFSIDGTRELLKSISETDGRIKLFLNESNIGLTKSLLKGLSLCRGDFIARQDADDKSFPTRLEEQVRVMINSNVDLLATSVITSDGRLVPGRLRMFFAHVLLLKMGNFFVHGSYMIRKSILDKYCYDSDMRFAQDYGLLLKLINADRPIGIVARPLYYLNVEGSRISNHYGSKQLECAREAQMRAFGSVYWGFDWLHGEYSRGSKIGVWLLGLVVIYLSKPFGNRIRIY